MTSSADDVRGGHRMGAATDDLWEVMSTARTIRRFTEEPVDDATLARCLQAAKWGPSGANAQARRFVVLRSPEVRAAVARAAAAALEMIELAYSMTRPDDADQSQRARTYRATYEIHDRAGEYTSVLFAQQKLPYTSDLLIGGSLYPSVQNFLLAARAQGLGACLTSWASYGGEAIIREAVGVPDDWFLAAHVVVGWPRGHHGPLRRHPLARSVYLDRWEVAAPEIVAHVESIEEPDEERGG